MPPPPRACCSWHEVRVASAAPEPCAPQPMARAATWRALLPALLLLAPTTEALFSNWRLMLRQTGWPLATAEDWLRYNADARDQPDASFSVLDELGSCRAYGEDTPGSFHPSPCRVAGRGVGVPSSWHRSPAPHSRSRRRLHPETGLAEAPRRQRRDLQHLAAREQPPDRRPRGGLQPDRRALLGRRRRQHRADPPTHSLCSRSPGRV